MSKVYPSSVSSGVIRLTCRYFPQTQAYSEGISISYQPSFSPRTFTSVPFFSREMTALLILAPARTLRFPPLVRTVPTVTGSAGSCSLKAIFTELSVTVTWSVGMKSAISFGFSRRASTISGSMPAVKCAMTEESRGIVLRIPASFSLPDVSSASFSCPSSDADSFSSVPEIRIVPLSSA